MSTDGQPLNLICAVTPRGAGPSADQIQVRRTNYQADLSLSTADLHYANMRHLSELPPATLHGTGNALSYHLKCNLTGVQLHQ